MISLARRAMGWMNEVATPECCLTINVSLAGPDGAVYVVMDEPGAISQVSILSK